MKRILNLLLIVFAVQNTSAEVAWLGFKKSDDANVPESIRKASKSVFKIIYPGAPTQVVDLSDESKFDDIIKRHEKKGWEMVQLAYCRVQAILKCPISPTENLGGGSAYVVRNNKTIATNLHNLHPWLSAVAANNNWKPEELKAKLAEIVVPIMLMDQEGKYVFNPADALSTGEAYRIKLINDDASLFVPTINKRQLGFALSDYVELEFKTEFNVPVLSLAKTSETASYFVVGFPGPTNLFAKSGLLDGNGINQMVSTGVWLESEKSANVGNAIIQAKYLTRISAPSYSGNSGGPVLNSSGEVVGTLEAGDLYHQVDGKPAYFSEFINALKLEDLQRTWKTRQP